MPEHASQPVYRSLKVLSLQKKYTNLWVAFSKSHIAYNKWMSSTVHSFMDVKYLNTNCKIYNLTETGKLLICSNL